MVSSWQSYFSRVALFTPSSLRPSFCVATLLSAAGLRCLCQFRRNMFSVQDVPALQSLCALTGVVFYGTILSLMWLDAKYVSFPSAQPHAIILPRKKHSGVACDTCCPICLTEFKRDEVLSCGERCGHCFHESCIQKWIAHTQRMPNQRATCPSCRQDLQCQRSPKNSKSVSSRSRNAVVVTTSPEPGPVPVPILLNIERGAFSPS